MNSIEEINWSWIFHWLEWGAADWNDNPTLRKKISGANYMSNANKSVLLGWGLMAEDEEDEKYAKYSYRRYYLTDKGYYFWQHPELLK